MIRDYIHRTYTYIRPEKAYGEGLCDLKKALADHDVIVIGAGAGLSTAAGFEYTGKRFHAYFHDFEMKYGIQDMYSGGFYPFETKEEFWAYWSRYIYVNRYMDPPKDTYHKLYELVKDKDYFVLTTNVDHCFQKAGFDKARLFYTQGDYGLFQCSTPCHKKTYDNEEIIMKMIKEQKDMKIPTKLIPKCPVHGEDMTLNLRSDETFVEDEGWHRAQKRYHEFLKKHKNDKILYLEIGVGGNTPVIIKYPFWHFTEDNKKATYVCVNYDCAFAPATIEDRSILIEGDADQILEDLKNESD